MTPCCDVLNPDDRVIFRNARNMYTRPGGINRGLLNSEHLALKMWDAAVPVNPGSFEGALAFE